MEKEITLNEAITLYLALKISNLSQTKWNKLMFFIDGVGVCQNGFTFSGYNYIKLPFGPVPDNYRDEIRKMIFKGIVKREQYRGVTDSVMYIEATTDYNNKKNDIEQTINKKRDLKKILDQIIGIFSSWSAVKMSDFTHELKAWKKPKLLEKIDLSLLKNDPFLKKRFDEANFATLVMSPL